MLDPEAEGLEEAPALPLPAAAELLLLAELPTVALPCRLELPLPLWPQPGEREAALLAEAETVGEPETLAVPLEPAEGLWPPEGEPLPVLLPEPGAALLLL